ncbi:NACHT domain-containing protein [Streptomyces griseocarneus]|uniref:NACHT domain-containing protein n=1 Tax=Streptomyces griseocarneus TaxID=51201 RepID=UPI00167E94F6|nr:hypothetical protein [Streptomyces griseocarneus]MBZ6476723.1 hypothetical protein [Streptomyces griseocarneus]
MATTRARLIAEIGRQWLPVLDRSLEYTVRVELDLSDRPDSVTDPWTPIRLRSAEGNRRFPLGTPLVQLYREEYDQRLLVLGAPGAGKTTQMLELTRDLLTAASDPGTPVPVPLLLSRWPGTSLEAWVLRELESLYRIDRAVARQFLEHGDITLILDGLDEVPSPKRGQCVKAINSFTTATGSGYPLIGVVVSCRSADYADLRQRLGLGGAVVIEPLNPEQVHRALRETSGMENLYEAAVSDRILTHLLTSPLMLSVAVLAYRDSSTDPALTLGNERDRRARIFDVYTVRMLTRDRGLRGQSSPGYGADKSWRALTRFAVILKRLCTDEFMPNDPLPTAMQFISLPIPFITVSMYGIKVAPLIDRAIKQRPLFIHDRAWTCARATAFTAFGLVIGSASCLLWSNGNPLAWGVAIGAALAGGAWSGMRLKYDTQPWPIGSRGRDERAIVIRWGFIRTLLMLPTLAAPPLVSLFSPWHALWILPGTWLLYSGWLELRAVIVPALIRWALALFIGVRSLRYFLAFGDERALLNRVGNSYRFLHATFLDHLALRVDQELPLTTQD